MSKYDKVTYRFDVAYQITIPHLISSKYSFNKLCVKRDKKMRNGDTASQQNSIYNVKCVRSKKADEIEAESGQTEKL